VVYQAFLDATFLKRWLAPGDRNVVSLSALRNAVDVSIEHSRIPARIRPTDSEIGTRLAFE
jgi:hypothetical protein